MGGLPSGPLGSISNIMNRRARSTPRFGSLLAGLAAALVLVAIGGYFLGSSGKPYRTAPEFPADQYLRESSSLRGNTYRLSGSVINSIAWSPGSGRLISVQVADSTSPVPLVLPASLGETNVQKGQRFDFLVEVRENGVLYATSITKS